MRVSRPLPRFTICLLLLACGAARALSIDGDTQIHAAIGQALAASVPVSLAGDEVSRLYYRLTPASGLAEAEERAAAAVHAAYDPERHAILLSTSQRVTVPAIRVHLEIGAGSVVVSRDLTVLFDVPDLSQSAPLDAAGEPKPAVKPAAASDLANGASAAVPEGAHAVAISKEETQKTAIAFGDAASSNGATAPAAGGSAEPRMMLAPKPKYYNTYQVKQGDTLALIGTHFARAGAGTLEQVMLAVYEANYDSFPPGDPQHPVVGSLLGIPDAASIGSEPGYRVAEFGDYLKKPVGEWQVPVNLLRKPEEKAPEQAPAPAPGWMQPHNLIGVGVILLLLWGARSLFSAGRHKRAVLAAQRAHASVGASVIPADHLRQVTPVAKEPAVELAPPPPPENEHVEIVRLRELLSQQPARADIRLRLAQRLFEARRAAGFAEVALPLEQVLSPEAWERVRAMGHELLPSDHRFQPQRGDAPAPELVSMVEKRQEPSARSAPASTIDFDFHGEMDRVDKARAGVFGKKDGDDQEAA